MKKILGVLAFFSGFAYADSGLFNILDAPQEKSKADTFFIYLSSGFLSGESSQFSYKQSDGRKQSQHDWKINNLSILKTDLSWAIDSSTTLSATGWISLDSTNGSMNYYAWNDDLQTSWTDNASHPNATVNDGNEFDLNMKVWVHQKLSSKLALMIGYQGTHFNWSAKGGSYNQNNGKVTGNYTDSTKIADFKQYFGVPYLGLTGSYRKNDFEYKALLKFSNKLTAEAITKDYINNEDIKDTVSNAIYFSSSLGIGYYFTQHFKIFIEGAYNLYAKEKGLSEVTDSNGTTTEYAKGASINNINYQTTAGLQYSF